MGRNRQRRGRHASVQPAAASSSVFASSPPIAAGAPAWPIRRCRFGGIRRASSTARQGWALRRSSGGKRRREGVRDWSRMAV